MYITGKAETFSSSHHQDKGTSITLPSGGDGALISKECLILNAEGKTGILLISRTDNLIDALTEQLKDASKKRWLYDNHLSIEYDNRGEPYCQGVLLLLGTPEVCNSYMTLDAVCDMRHRHDTHRGGQHSLQDEVSVFLHTNEVQRLLTIEQMPT